MATWEFTDPILNNKLQFDIVSAGHLEVAKFQRKPSKAHIKSLMLSISRMGFLVPLVVYPESSEKFIIIDGQHRFLAGKELGMQEFPVIIVPKELGTKIINLNIEKQPNIREKAFVAYNLYQYHLSNNPEMKETDAELEDSVELPHYITLGFTYQLNEKFHGSSFEPVLTKCEAFLDLPLHQAKEERENRAELLNEIDQLVTQIVEKMKELDINIHPFIRKDIISFANPLKGRGKRGEFWETLSTIKNTLADLIEHPKKLIEIKSEEEALSCY